MAETGDIVLIAPEQAHSCNPVGMPRSYLMAHVDAAWFHGHMGARLHQAHGLRIRKPLVRDGALFATARGLLETTRAGLPSVAPAAVAHALTELLGRMQARHQCFSPLSDAAERRAPALAVRSLTDRGMLDWIMAGEYSVAALAHSAGVCRESFSRSFHRVTGLPPISYLHCLRLEYGRRLLQEGCSVAQAAAASGYADQSHFHRMFLKYCSVTPGCYRKNRSHSYKK